MPRRDYSTWFAAIPHGIDDTVAVTEGVADAQPPANGLNPSGMKKFATPKRVSEGSIPARRVMIRRFKTGDLRLQFPKRPYESP